MVGVGDGAAQATYSLLTVDSVVGHLHELWWQDTLRLLVALELSGIEEWCPADSILVTVTGGFNRLRRSGVCSSVVIGHINLLLKLSTLLYVRGGRLFIHHVPW